MILWQIYSGNRTKFHQNRQSFMGDIMKKHFGLFFPDTLYIGLKPTQVDKLRIL